MTVVTTETISHDMYKVKRLEPETVIETSKQGETSPMRSF